MHKETYILHLPFSVERSFLFFCFLYPAYFNAESEQGSFACAKRIIPPVAGNKKIYLLNKEIKLFKAELSKNFILLLKRLTLSELKSFAEKCSAPRQFAVPFLTALWRLISR